MRSPIYLDVALLRQMADYYDVPVPHDAQVTRKVVDTSGRGVGFDKVVKANSDRSATEEVTETYQSELRPVKLLNDLVDELSVSERTCDLTQDPSAQVVHRQPILAEGDVEVAPASEIGEVISKFMPLMTGMMQEGRTTFEPSQQELAQQFFREDHDQAPYVMRMDVEGCELDVYFVLDPQKFEVGTTLEDATAELTVFGLIERIVQNGSTHSLDRYLVPGLNRTMRRLMGKDAIRNLVSSTTELRGGAVIDPEDLNIRGPAVLVKVASLFT